MTESSTIQYQPLHERINDEEELLSVLTCLKQDYEKMAEEYDIKDQSGEKIKDFREFTKLATVWGGTFDKYKKEPIALLKKKNTRSIFSFFNRPITYDLSKFSEMIYYSPFRVSCHGCVNRALTWADEDSADYGCTRKTESEKRMDKWVGYTCLEYGPDSKIGKSCLPQFLEKIIDETSVTNLKK
ncbi:hypothetical protein ACFLZZ_03225 [Nanoarchaeota archaeon]